MKTIQVSTEDPFAIVRFSRDEVRNAISLEMVEELLEVVEWAKNTTQVQVLIFTGSRTAFSAGADLKALNLGSWEIMEGFLDRVNELCRRLEALPKISVAAVSGIAYGGGLEMALGCDFRVLTSDARLALPEVAIGVMPGAGGTQRLPRLIGYHRAKYMALSGIPVVASQALEWGLADVVCQPEDLLASAKDFCQPFLTNAPLSLGAIKESLRRGQNLELSAGLDLERHLLRDLYFTEDAREGIGAFNQKRPPLYRGR